MRGSDGVLPSASCHASQPWTHSERTYSFFCMFVDVNMHVLTQSRDNNDALFAIMSVCLFGRILGERHKKTTTQSPTEKTCWFMLICAGLCGLPRESCWLRTLSKNYKSVIISFHPHVVSYKIILFYEFFLCFCTVKVNGGQNRVVIVNLTKVIFVT